MSHLMLAAPPEQLIDELTPGHIRACLNLIRHATIVARCAKPRAPPGT
jgi:hypothetical protein